MLLTNAVICGIGRDGTAFYFVRSKQSASH